VKKITINLKDPRLRIPVLVGLVALGGGYYWYSQVYTSLRTEQESISRQLVAKQDTLRTIQALKPQLSQLREELRLSQLKLDSLKSIFPDQKEIPKLIRELTSVASASGINTTKFNPMPDVEREYFIENHYQIAVDGGYHNLAEFFAFLANFTLIINLSNVNIAANPEAVRSETSPAVGSQASSMVAMFEMTTFSSKK
jgi:type IV pilus assembly protein PilO